MKKNSLFLFYVFLVATSLFGQQQYYKVLISEEGIYKISGNDLINAGMDITNIKPQTIQLFSDSQKMLPYSTQADLPELRELAIKVYSENDSVFSADDYIMFYAQARNRFEWDDSLNTYGYISNSYDSLLCYWLRWNVENGKRITVKSGSLQFNSALIVNQFRDYLHFEKDKYNPLKSGLVWTWNIFNDNSEFNYHFALDSIMNETADFKVSFYTYRFYSTSVSPEHTVAVNLNGTQTNFSFYRRKTFSQTFSLINGDNLLEFSYSADPHPDNAYRVGIDWFEISYLNSTILFGESKKIYFGNMDGIYHVEYNKNMESDSVRIYDITDVFNVSEIATNDSYFEDQANNIHKVYYLLRNGYEKSVMNIEAAQREVISASGGADYIIIVPAAFEAEVLPLAEHRQSYNGFAVKVVKMEDIYNQFAFGRRDPTALRNFIRFAYENWTPQPRYILLAGNGYFDYRNITKEYPDNWIPTIEISDEFEVNSKATDDYFADVDFAGNDLIIMKKPELAIGRLPADNSGELNVLVGKIIENENNFKPGLWRISNLFIADDENAFDGSDYNIFLAHTERIAESNIPKAVRKYKMYLTEYPFEGRGKPSATAQLVNWMNNGVKSIYFEGFASEYMLTHEKLFDIERDKDKVNNYKKYAFYYGATQLCKFDQYQNGIVQALLKERNKGFHAALVPSRIVYTGQVYEFATLVYQYIYEQNKDIGTAVMHAKNRINMQKYVLLGDPAVKINLPENIVSLDEIKPDTLKALSLVRINGSITNPTDADSLVVEVREPTVSVNGAVNYEMEGKAVFRGLVPVNSGSFSFQFVVPSDIPHDLVSAKGKIFAYTWNGKREGMGFVDSVMMGGVSESPADNTPPLLSLSINKSEEALNLYADLFDSSGINLSSLGNHQPMIFFDDNYGDTLFISDFFMYAENSYQSGKIVYPLPLMDEGNHSLTLVIHDNYNNFTADSIEFQITSINENIVPTEIILSQNYPNPFNPQTTIPVRISGDGIFKVKLDIYNILGQKVKTVFNDRLSAGDYSFVWNGKNGNGSLMPSGIYIYRLWAANNAFDGAKNQKGTIITQIKKMTLIR